MVELPRLLKTCPIPDDLTKQDVLLIITITRERADGEMYHSLVHAEGLSSDVCRHKVVRVPAWGVKTPK